MVSNGPNFPGPRPPLVVRTTPLEEEFLVGTGVLGAGINGKVVECFDSAGEKYALKVREILIDVCQILAPLSQIVTPKNK